MKYFHKAVFAVSILLLTSCLDTTPTANELETNVKRSSSGICHDHTSSSYTRTKNFKAFDSLQACLEDGGRLPKSKTTQYDAAEQEAVQEGRSFVALYNRDEWPHWIDDDGDCQNTRHELLISTSRAAVSFKTEKSCNVLDGEWFDPYSGDVFHDSIALDLDHIVPLKFAHGHGGDKWSREKRKAFANDRENLLLVKASLNRQKGAKGPDEWLPPNHLFRCEYIANFAYIIDKYGLKLVSSEKRIVDKMQLACKG
ncbi:HNH endonuclease family protein [Alteromonas lipotrueae]|uniref:HNH endonuclease family protein n=1 Tax=Alteromonas lipotrueae TaxID=2803814 RepID=UPI001C453778|nr:HNH endonuclease family protein [Alteromonas lipotrueae]